MPIIHSSETCEICEKHHHYFSVQYICIGCYKLFKPMIDAIYKQFILNKRPSSSRIKEFTKIQKIAWRLYRTEVDNRFKRMREYKERLEIFVFETKAFKQLNLTGVFHG